MSDQLAQIVRVTGTLSAQELDLGIRQATSRNLSLWDVLVEERRVSEEALAQALAARLNLLTVRIESLDIQPAALKAVSGTLARKHICLPISVDGRRMVLAMANPLDEQAKRDVQFASNRRVEPVVACRSDILIGIEKYYPPPQQPLSDGAPVSVAEPGAETWDVDGGYSSEHTDRAPAVQLCHLIVMNAMKANASDIHIEPGPQEFRVRFRIDGVLQDHCALPRWMHASLVSRIKILAKLDIAQQRLPQDGRIRAKNGERAIDLRISTLPTHLGEKVVMRLLGSAAVPTLDALGLSAGETQLIDEALSQPQGLILVTGPTGAGKSTTLYSMLARRHTSEVNIVTIEDPIEYQVSDISQVQVDVKAGLTFAGALRSILRQDPDVILVGEIRDLETAEIAFRAAHTGHLVLTTLHTNGSLSAVERLLDLGVRPLLVTAATNLIIAQRLARRICRNCREPYVPPAKALRRLGLDGHSQEFHHGKGCGQCGNTGYAGRLGIFEILRMTPALRACINRQASETKLRSAALAAGTRLLLADAICKVREGLTTVEEVLRVIRIDHSDEIGPRQAGASLRRSR
jgi:type IV pilus assembly protein PilB